MKSKITYSDALKDIHKVLLNAKEIRVTQLRRKTKRLSHNS